ncbi:MAG: TrkA C-terminal domain-containing protein [Planctomycetaceae bacterium]|nr:TrkA C-terminal domain-containing protein [Planctomycetaceae bacterium]
MGARAIEKTLRELNLRAQMGATLLAVQRDSALTTVPPADFQFPEHDVLVLAGNSHQMASALDLIAGADDASV